MDFIGFKFHEDSNKKESQKKKEAKERLLALKKWHDNFFQKKNKPLLHEKKWKNNRGKPTKVIFKIITTIGIFVGSGIVESEAMEKALDSAQIKLKLYAEKVKKKTEKARERRLCRKTKSAIYAQRKRRA